MRSHRSRRKHDVAMKKQIVGFMEGNALCSQQEETCTLANRQQLRLDGRRVYGVCLFTREPEQHGTIGAMSFTGQRQRAKEFCADSSRASKESIGLQS